MKFQLQSDQRNCGIALNSYHFGNSVDERFFRFDFALPMDLLKKPIVLIAGASGFIGKHLVSAIDTRGKFDVVELNRGRANDRKSDPRSISLYDAQWQKAVEGIRPDVIVNLAVDYGRSSDLRQMIECNVLLAIELLKIARASGTRCFVSGDSFYSKFNRVPDQMMNYLLLKKSVHHWLEYAGESVVSVAARLEHVYGPGDGGHKFVPMIMAELAKSNESEALKLTSGKQIRDFVYVSDVVDAIQSIIDWGFCAPPEFRTVEVGTGVGTELRNFVELLYRHSKSSRHLEWGALSVSENEIEKSTADLLFLDKLGWVPKVSTAEGVRLLVESYNQKVSI